MNKKIVTIMRGISGSGKSTVCGKLGLPKHTAIVSADYFFIKPDGNGKLKYKFDSDYISKAHSACLTDFLLHVQKGTDSIIVDNTNSCLWEFENYELIAKEHGYDVQIVQIVVKTVEEIKVCIKRNVHKVPSDTIFRMALKFEPTPEGKNVRNFEFAL